MLAIILHETNDRMTMVDMSPLSRAFKQGSNKLVLLHKILCKERPSYNSLLLRESKN